MKKMDNSIKITLIVVVAVIALVLIGSFAYFRANPSSIITVQGESTIEVAPDLVVVYFDVLTEGTTAQNAKDANAGLTNNAVDSLVNAGFAKEEVQTLNYNVQPKYSWTGGERRQVGYTATHTLRLEISIENTNLVGDAIDAGVGAGANVNYINYELTEENQNKYKAEAMQKATEDARNKAEAMAQGLGKKVGRLVSVSSSDFGYYPMLAYAEKAAASGDEVATQIQPSDQEINARVSVIYSIS